MTSDGINDIDWEKVAALAAEAANASSIEDDVLTEIAVERLLKYLANLEAKYGKKPSVLAVKADYVDSTQQRVALLKEALRLAQATGDRMNCHLIEDDLRDEAAWGEDDDRPIEQR